MKLNKECIACQMKRAMLIAGELPKAKKKELSKKINQLFTQKNLFSLGSIKVAYKRNQIIKKVVGSQAINDKFRDKNMKTAQKISYIFQEELNQIPDNKKRFYKSLMMSVAGNLIEFGAAGHRINLSKLEEELRQTIETIPTIDDREKIYQKVKSLDNSNSVLYLVDNAPEAVFDKFFIKELAKYSRVVVVALSEPVQDDACIADLKYLEIDKIPGCKIVSKGEGIGIYLPATTSEFKEEFKKADLIVAKRMACYESLSEYSNQIKDRTIFLLKAKCEPVARHASEFFGLEKKLDIKSTIIKLY